MHAEIKTLFVGEIDPTAILRRAKAQPQKQITPRGEKDGVALGAQLTPSSLIAYTTSSITIRK
jgi:hypothetical protein